MPENIAKIHFEVAPLRLYKNFSRSSIDMMCVVSFWGIKKSKLNLPQKASLFSTGIKYKKI